MSLADSLFDRLLLPVLRRRELESGFLRDYFKRRYDIEIGLYSYGCFDRWRIPQGTRIGRYCSFAKSSVIMNANHPIDALSTHPFLYDPRAGVVDEPALAKRVQRVEDDVWLGHNAVVTPSVSVLGRGCIVGSGSVVTKDVPRYAVVAGVPARIIRYRFDEATRRAIDESEWWRLDKRALRQFLRDDPLARALRPDPETTRGPSVRARDTAALDAWRAEDPHECDAALARPIQARVERHGRVVRPEPETAGGRRHRRTVS